MGAFYNQFLMRETTNMFDDLFIFLLVHFALAQWTFLRPNKRLYIHFCVVDQ